MKQFFSGTTLPDTGHLDSSHPDSSLLDSGKLWVRRLTDVATESFITGRAYLQLTFVLLVPTLFMWLPNHAHAQAIRVMVVDFTSSVGTNFTRRLPELIVDELVNSGQFDVLERAKLTSIAKEFSFQAGALVDPSKAVEIGNMSGAQLMITGNIVENSSSRKTATSYGIKSTITRHYLKARIEVVDLKSGSKIFSHIAKDTAVLKTTGLNSVGSDESAIGPSVAAQMVGAMVKNPRIKGIVEAAGGGQVLPVMISILSVPKGADVEIDGVYFGNAGGEFEVNPGVHEISVSLPGYTLWSKKVKVRDKLTFTARLTESVDSKIAIQVEEVNGNSVIKTE